MKNKKVVCAVSVFLVIVVIVLSVFGFVWLNLAKVNPYITEEEIVYVPETLPRKFYYDLVWLFFGNDVFEYWVIKPDKDDKAALLEDIQNGNWSNYNNQYEEMLCNLNYYSGGFSEAIIAEQLNTESTYICFYDDVKGEVVETIDGSLPTSHWIIFIYDSVENIYYCIHQSY